MKLIKYGEKGCGRVEAEGPANFIRFAFDQYKPRARGQYAELYDDDGKLIGRADVGVRELY